MGRLASLVIVGLAAVLGVAVMSAQSSNVWVSRDHPAIQYSKRPPATRSSGSTSRSRRATIALTFDAPPRAYLASMLKALDIPASSQTLVFSENSLQRSHISQRTPRAIYFNDTVAVAWAKGAETIEATALDSTQGVHLRSDSADAPAEAAVRSP